jgi:hypothetical protein
MPLLRTAIIVFALAMTVVWGISYVRPVVLQASRTPQEVWFLDASHGRLRLTQQRVSPAVVMGLTTDAATLHTITMRDAAGAVAATERDPLSSYRDAKSPWWFDENAGNHIMSISPTPAGSANLTMRFVCVPIWVIVALTVVPPLALRVRVARVRWRRSRQGLCPKCGYDLRGTPQQCPECGMGSAPRTPAAA